MPRLFTILISRLNSETAFGPAWSKISSWPACTLSRDATHLRRSERTVSPSIGPIRIAQKINEKERHGNNAFSIGSFTKILSHARLQAPTGKRP